MVILCTQTGFSERWDAIERAQRARRSNLCCLKMCWMIRVESTEEDNKEAGEFLIRGSLFDSRSSRLALFISQLLLVHLSALFRPLLLQDALSEASGFELSTAWRRRNKRWSNLSELHSRCRHSEPSSRTDVPLISSTDIKDDNVRGQNPHRC